MADYPYTLNPSKLTTFLGHIVKAGVPPKVGQDYLKKAGFKSHNDRAIIKVLKHIGFLDLSGVPTEKYRAFRNSTSGPSILAGCIRSSYSDLFQIYPDAHQRDTEALRNFFAEHTKGGDSVLTAMVSTFKNLCQKARFDENLQPTSSAVPEETRQPKTLAPRGIESFVINIQLTLPATSDGKIYEEFFKAMKKHLLEGKE